MQLWCKKARRKAVTFTLASLLAASISASAVAETVCWTGDSQSALRTRVLQTDLMVAALNCGMQSDYNLFIKRFSAPLVVKGRALKALFRDSFGPGYKRSLDRFVTRLANEASMRSLRNPDSFCSDATVIMGTAKSLHPNDFPTLVKGYGFGHLHGVPACSVKDAGFAQKANAG